VNRAPHIHGKLASFSASNALETIGADLRKIKDEDGLSWKDVGRVLGKSDDRAADYASAISEMPVTSFLLGLREWNGRLGGNVLALIGQKLGPADVGDMTDNEKLSHILRLAHLMSVALSDEKTPGVADDEELCAIGSEALDEAARSIDALRSRLAKIVSPPVLRSVAPG